MKPLDHFSKKLSDLDSKHRLRLLAPQSGIDLSSNDYLGFSDHPLLRYKAIEALEGGIAIGATGSRLLRGNCPEHEKLESHAAQIFKSDKALYFASGFQAGMAVFSTLPSRHDVVLYDSLIHACAKDGMRAGLAKIVSVLHNDLNAYEDTLKRFRDKAETLWVAVESVYSMDGDFAPLSELYDLCRRYDAVLIVDEAHGTGVWGKKGRGLCAELPDHDSLISIHTCGKALGVAGGLVCAPAGMIDYMVNAARPFVYSTAPPPLQAHLVNVALGLMQSEEGEQCRKHLHSLCTTAQEHFGGAGGQIIPIIIGGDARAVQIAEHCQNAGYDICAIRPPTVPEGSARLRLSLNATLSEDDFALFLKFVKPLLV